MAIEKIRDSEFYSTHKWHNGIMIEMLESSEAIRVEVRSLYHDRKEFFGSKKFGIMTSPQKLEYMEDCLNITTKRWRKEEK